MKQLGVPYLVQLSSILCRFICIVPMKGEQTKQTYSYDNKKLVYENLLGKQKGKLNKYFAFVSMFHINSAHASIIIKNLNWKQA